MGSPVKHLYIHVPFCPSKCAYCAFVTHVGSLRLMPDYLRAVELDLERAAQARRGESLSTVYFGGGTPTMMAPEQAARLISRARELFGLEDSAELTIEAHPATVNAGTLSAYRAAGLTRVSFGAESLNGAELLEIGRQYDAERVGECIRASRDAGFSSVALDLMYGLPGQSLGSWSATLQRALAMDVDHLSLYPLAIEPRTVFARRQRRGALNVPGDEAVVEMYHLACAQLRAAGYVHYEFSNWARPGHDCRHNVACWLHEEYYGVGTGAHAYLRPYREARVAGVKRYVDRIAAGLDPVDAREEIDEAAEAAEAAILGLRLLDRGIELTGAEGTRGAGAEAVGRLAEGGLVRMEGSRLRLTEAAVPVANEVIALLM